jgi:hypothetical protein
MRIGLARYWRQARLFVGRGFNSAVRSPVASADGDISATKSRGFSPWPFSDSYVEVTRWVIWQPVL